MKTFLAALTLTAATITCHAQEFPFSDVLNDPTLTEAQCGAMANTVWATAEWTERFLGMNVTKTAKGCIRYFPSDRAQGATSALFFLHGDVLHYGPNVDKGNYEKVASTQAQTEMANRLADKIGMPVVRIARPGTFGSTGMNHKVRRQYVETYLVNAAVTQIKEKLGYERISLAGQSGGGGLVGALLTLGRTDVNCAVMGSGVVSVKSRMKAHDYLTYSKGMDATGMPLSSVYDPVEHVEGVKPDPKRRVFVLGDPHDGQVVWSSQVEFATKLREAGMPATVLEGQAMDPLHHVVASQAQWVGGWCNKGMTDEAMQAKLSAPRQLTTAPPEPQ